MAKFAALKNCLRFASQGADLESKSALFKLGLLDQLDHPRKRIKKYVDQSLCKRAFGGLLRISVKSTSGGSMPAVLRAGNGADYQSAWECLNETMYPLPKVEIHHIFDGGANIGLFSLFCAARLHVVDIFVAEPNPANHALLRKNLAFLRAERIFLGAISSENGDATFELLASNTGHLRERPGRPAGGTSISVPCRRLGELIPQEWNMKYTWLKLDIEGAEYEVLTDLLRSFQRPIVVSAEIHDYLNAGGEALVHELREAGYKVVVWGSGAAGNVCRQIMAIYQDKV